MTVDPKRNTGFRQGRDDRSGGGTQGQVKQREEVPIVKAARIIVRRWLAAGRTGQTGAHVHEIAHETA
jgi:hypothetical protein